MIKIVSLLVAAVVMVIVIAACDNYSHNSIVTTPPVNYVSLIMVNDYGGNGFDWGTSVATTADDEYVITGTTTSNGNGENTLYLSKIDSDRWCLLQS